MDQEIAEINLERESNTFGVDSRNEVPISRLQGKKLFVSPKMNKTVFIVAGVVVAIFAILFVLIGIPMIRLLNDAKTASSTVAQVKEAAKSQDLQKMKASVGLVRKQLLTFKSDASALGWTKAIPLFGGYTNDLTSVVIAGEAGLDAADILISAIEPYADIVGLKGQGSFTGGTTEERIAKIVETLDKVTPQIDAVAEKMVVIRTNFDKIDPNRYPETFQGKPLRSQIFLAKELVDQLDKFLGSARPMIKKLPELLGAKESKKYMILFQNDKELRPTGGFITAYAIFRVEKGKIHLESSDDIYKLDDTMTKHVAPPEAISKYLNVYGWRMRDANFSPDFESSMKVFEDLYATSSQKQKIDGIIAMDTNVLVAMIDVLGPVSAYGANFTTQKVPECDCPMVIYELEKFADEPKGYERGGRKDIIGVMLQEIMRKAMTSAKQTSSQLFSAGLKQAKQKHIMVYFQDPDVQAGAEALGFAGRTKTYGGDYLHVNDANLGGAKSNLYIVPSVKQDVSITDKGADVTLTLEYRYPKTADNCSLERKSGLCLAGIYRDYVRVYLPQGTTIGEVRGFENKSTTFEDLGHVVADGFFTVVPQGLARISLKYSVPGDFKKKGEYRSLIQKQPGTMGNHYKVTVNGKLTEFDLTEDRELVVKI